MSEFQQFFQVQRFRLKLSRHPHLYTTNRLTFYSRCNQTPPHRTTRTLNTKFCLPRSAKRIFSFLPSPDIHTPDQRKINLISSELVILNKIEIVYSLSRLFIASNESLRKKVLVRKRKRPHKNVV